MSGSDDAFTRAASFDFLTFRPVPDPEMKVGDEVTVIEPGGVAKFVIESITPADPDDPFAPHEVKVSFRAI